MSEIDLFTNPFDALRRLDGDVEFWTARDLQKPLGYERWESFVDAIERAQLAAKNSGVGGSHFAASRSDGGRWGGQALQDFRLTRYGAYLVALIEVDPDRPAQAKSTTYVTPKGEGLIWKRLFDAGYVSTPVMPPRQLELLSA